ncbi:YjfB family protein [Aminipila terrae]|uniref:Putative motility protein n=1 Tax=Aminipila terrae TaxID=2697030 RepID=A0A6P1MEV2_9FIRM|nr:YjfB family protein [Aminipila terrae]QHI73190.1 putative motility protein [Aminipila terrae]
MDGILSSYTGLQAQQLQQNVSMSVLNMAMDSQSQAAQQMIADMPPAPAAQGVPVAKGELGFNIDVYA